MLSSEVKKSKVKGVKQPRSVLDCASPLALSKSSPALVRPNIRPYTPPRSYRPPLDPRGARTFASRLRTCPHPKTSGCAASHSIRPRPHPPSFPSPPRSGTCQVPAPEPAHTLTGTFWRMPKRGPVKRWTSTQPNNPCNLVGARTSFSLGRNSDLHGTAIYEDPGVFEWRRFSPTPAQWVDQDGLRLEIGGNV